MSEPDYLIGYLYAAELAKTDIKKLKDENTSLKQQLEQLPKMVAWGRGLEHDKRLLQEDNARLKAEVEKLTFDPMSYLDDHGEWMPRYTHLVAVERLKAEVERLTKENETITKDRALLWASHKIALQDIQGLHYALQAAKGVQS